MRILMAFLSLLFIQCQPKQQEPHWHTTDTGSKASLRGLYAVNSQVCWASGSEGAVIRTINGGNSWQNVSVPGMDTLQFRDIHAFGKDTAMVLSAGLPARIFKTTDGGQNWQMVYQNDAQGVFFDAMDFWGTNEGLAFSDAIGNKLLIIRTNDGGDSWTVVPDSVVPEVLAGQGGFAASGTCLRTFGKGKVAIGLGGNRATVLLSDDFGYSWTTSTTPLDQGRASAGNYSFAFVSSEHIFCVGGDYTGDSATTNSICESLDGGQSWTVIDDPAINGKYRSCIISIGSDTLVATSRTGCSYSHNGGKTWKELQGSFYTVSAGKDGSIWASGPEGAVSKLKW